MIGWPNHPGRPELLDHSIDSTGFQLLVQLHPPDYLGGLTEEQVEYGVYIANSGLDFNDVTLVAKSNTAGTVHFRLTNIDLLGGVGSLLNTYYAYTQLEFTYDPSLLNVDMFARPTLSPFLYLRTFCELIG